MPDLLEREQLLAALDNLASTFGAGARRRSPRASGGFSTPPEPIREVVYSSGSSPRRRAAATASPREPASSFRRIAET